MLNVSDPLQADSISATNRYAPTPDENRAAAAPDTAILGTSEAMRRLRMQVRLIGPHFRMVLLHGEDGTGKRLAAETLHRYSSHAAGPFVVHDCDRGGLTVDDLAASLMAAHRGTVYLRNIHRMRRNAQEFLLETLQSRERVPPRRIVVHGLEARTVAATTEDLRGAVSAGMFSHELYRRIGSVTVVLPPLRDHAEDIPAIADGLLSGLGVNDPARRNVLGQEILGSRKGHRWPGNGTELQRLLAGFVVAEDGLDRLPPLVNVEPLTQPSSEDSSGREGFMDAARLQQVVEQHVLQVLKQCSGNKVKAAEVLGISRSTLYRMLEAGPKEDRLFG